MLKQLTHTQVWVHDRDEALAFYTEKLGMELREDVTVPELGNFRWLSVGVPGQPDVSITLMAVPGRPCSTTTRGRKSRRCWRRAPREALLRHRRREGELRGAEGPRRPGSAQPTEQPYGVDAGFRDPSGNHFRMAQSRDWAELQRSARPGGRSVTPAGWRP